MESQRDREDRVIVSFTNDDVLALSHWMDVHQRQDDLGFEHRAERRAFNDFLASLEPFVDEAFSSTYDEGLQSARGRLGR